MVQKCRRHLTASGLECWVPEQRGRVLLCHCGPREACQCGVSVEAAGGVSVPMEAPVSSAPEAGPSQWDWGPLVRGPPRQARVWGRIKLFADGGGGSAPRARKPRAGGLSRKRTLRSSAPPSWTFLLLFFAGPQWTGAVGPPDRWRLSSTWRICSPAVPFRRRLPHARNLFSNGAFSARASSCAQDESSGRVWASGTTSARWQRVSLLGRSWSMLS